MAAISLWQVRVYGVVTKASGSMGGISNVANQGISGTGVLSISPHTQHCDCINFVAFAKTMPHGIRTPYIIVDECVAQHQSTADAISDLYILHFKLQYSVGTQGSNWTLSPQSSTSRYCRQW